MGIKHITLKNFRSYRGASFAFSPGINVIEGPNGAGKTNLLEALAYSLSLRSPRTSKESHLLHHHTDFFRLKTDLDTEGEEHTLEVAFQNTQGRRVFLNKVPQQNPEELLQPLLIFLPDHLAVVKGGPTLRRDFLDRAISVLSTSYAATLTLYKRALAQRNHLLFRLKTAKTTAQALMPWHNKLAQLGFELTKARHEFLHDLAPHLVYYYRLLAGQGSLRAEYECSWPFSMEREESLTSFVQTLQETLEGDLEATQTRTGPHRDDLTLLLESHSLRFCGSQGEQRSAYLALLLALRALWQDRGVTPLLLLDDVMSELDDTRCEHLMSCLDGEGQVVLTTTHKEEIARHTASLHTISLQ